MVSNKQIVLLIGGSRSGTTWLQSMLSAHPSVCTTTELMLFNFYTLPLIKAWDKQIQLTESSHPLGLPTLWTQSEFREFLREFLDRTYERVLENKPGASVLLDKHPGYSLCVEHINMLLSNAKFIHLVRDGRDVVASLLKASKGFGALWAPSEVESAASMWLGQVRGAQKARQYQDRYLEVRYEDLLADGTSVLHSVFEFIDLPVSLEDTTSIYEAHEFSKMKGNETGGYDFNLPKGFLRKGQIGDWRNVLNPLERYVFHAVAGDLLCELGYAKEQWWRERAYQRFTLPLLSIFLGQHGLRQRIKRTLKGILGARWIPASRMPAQRKIVNELREPGSTDGVKVG